MNNKKGFTLAELLIVVAIIAVLTAVAIPIFTQQLERSREETDIANMRSGQAAAVAWFLDHTASGTATTIYFNAQAGDVQEQQASISAYGRGTTTNGRADAYPNYNNGTAYVGSIIQYTRDVNASGVETITPSWVPAT